MPIFEKHSIIYATENQLVAENIAATYHSIGKEATLIEREVGNYVASFNELSIPDDDAIILLVSINFLQSYGCMNGLLQAAQQWGKQKRLIPLVTDGVLTDEDGHTQSVETKFERVGEIIQFMNFWQDKYLDLRKERREKKEDAGLDVQINVAKEIAGEIGEFLRYIKKVGYHFSKEYVSYIEQSKTGKSSDDSVPEGAALLPPKKWGKKEFPETSEKDLIEMIEKSSEELMAELENDRKEKQEIIQNEQKEEEFSEEMINQIPGLEMLANLDSEKISSHQNPSKKTEKGNGFTKKEMEKIDQENDELMTILDEVLQEAGIESEDETDEFKFMGDDPDDPDSFNLESLFEEEEEITLKKSIKESPSSELSENEVLLNLIEGENNEAEEADVQAVLEEAIDLFRENNLEAGIECFELAVEDYPNNTTLRYYFAYSLAKFAHEYELAKSQLGTLLKQENNHPDAWFLLAELAENQQDFEGARKCFEKTIAADETFPDVHHRLGLLLIEHFDNEFEEAAELLESALALDENNTDAAYMLATVMNERLGQKELSIKHFKKTLSLHPDHPFANYDLAMLYHEFGDTERANIYYQQAIVVNPELKTTQNESVFLKNKESEELVEESIENMDEFTSGEELLETLPEPMPMIEKNIKTVMVTGGTAGIGKATAEIFAQNGYRVIITGRRKERLDEISNQLVHKYNTPCHSLNFDVRNIESVKEAIESLPDEWKNIDILINNAGLSRGLKPIDEGSVEDWDAMIDTNVKGLLYMTRAVSPFMVKNKSGHIINVSSIAGTEVYPGGNVYCASKAAVSSLTRSMRLDLHQYNIRVSQVAPGHVEETEFARVRFDWDTEKAAKVYENFQPLTSTDIAETIYFIASRPPHVNIQDIYMYSTQQANATTINRSGR